MVTCLVKIHRKDPIVEENTGPQFKVSSEKQLVFVGLTSPGIEPTTPSFQVGCSIQPSYAG